MYGGGLFFFFFLKYHWTLLKYPVVHLVCCALLPVHIRKYQKSFKFELDSTVFE